MLLVTLEGLEIILRAGQTTVPYRSDNPYALLVEEASGKWAHDHSEGGWVSCGQSLAVGTKNVILIPQAEHTLSCNVWCMAALE